MILGDLVLPTCFWNSLNGAEDRETLSLACIPGRSVYLLIVLVLGVMTLQSTIQSLAYCLVCTARL